jgi:excisionase family DNA binding protein
MSVANGNDRLLTADDVAELLGMRTDFIYRLAREGRIPHLRFGRTLRFRAEAIERWLEEQEQFNDARR